MTDKQKWKLLCKCTAKKFNSGYDCSLIEVKNSFASVTDGAFLVKLQMDIPDGHYNKDMQPVETKVDMPSISNVMSRWKNIGVGSFCQKDTFMEEMKELCKNKKQGAYISFFGGEVLFDAKKLYIMCQAVPEADVFLWSEKWVDEEVRYSISFETKHVPNDPYEFAVLMCLRRPYGMIEVKSTLFKWDTLDKDLLNKQINSKVN